MTDPFMLDQKEVEVALSRLQDSVSAWQRLRRSALVGGGSGGGGVWTDSMEYELQGLDGTIRNGIRDAKWSLEELEETLKLLAEHETQFVDGENLNSRRAFLEAAKKSLAKIELEILAPPPKPPAAGAAVNRGGVEAEESADDGPEGEWQGRPRRTSQRPAAKSVSWHRHLLQSDDDVVQVVDEAVWRTAKPRLRFIARVLKYRLWISLAIAVALFLLVLLVMAVFKTNRALSTAAAAAYTTVATPPSTLEQ